MIYDLAIVGAGLSAGPVIEHLAHVKPDADVLILDRGVDYPYGTLPKLLWSHNGRVKEISPWWTSARVGGAANLWYGQLSRFQEPDFFVPGSRSEWIVGERDFAPFFSAIESKLRPYCGNHLLTGTASVDIERCTPRDRLARFENDVYNILECQGWEPYSGQTCLGGQGWSSAPVDPITLAPLNLVAPQMHKRNWVFRIMQVLRNSGNMTFAQGQRVNAILPSRNYYALVCQEAGGGTCTFRARYIVLAAGVTSTVPLLRTLPEPSMLLGQSFTLSSELTAYLATDLQRGDKTDSMIGRFAHISSRHLYPSERQDPMGGKVSVYDAESFDGPDRLVRKLSMQGVSMPDYGLVLKLSFKGTSEPSARKRISFTEHGVPVFHYGPTNADLKLIELVERRVCALIAAFPGGRILTLTDNVRGDDPTSAHLHGGAVFGANPENSVLSCVCEVWNAPNVFVADASFMPSSGGTNSSHTTMANSLRVAHIVAERL